MNSVDENILNISYKYLDEQISDKGDVYSFTRKYIRHKNPEIRMRLLELIGLHCLKRLSKYVHEGLSDKNELIRATACETASKLGLKKYIPDIILLLKKDNPIVRMSAADAIGILGNKGHIDFLMSQISSDRNSEVRLRVTYALYALSKNAKYFENLFDFLNHPYYRVRCATAYYLSESITAKKDWRYQKVLSALGNALKIEKLQAVKSSLKNSISHMKDM